MSNRHIDLAALVGRVFFALMFLVFGWGKITGYAGTVGYMGSLGLPAPTLFTFVAIVVEIGGGLLIVAGYQTRLVALGLGIYIFVSAFIAHFQLADFNQFQHFWKNMGLFGGALALVACGAGAYSIDAKRSSEPNRKL